MVAPSVARRFGFGLVDGTFAFGRRRHEIAIFQGRNQLALLYVIAASHIELLNRRGYFRYDIGLILREEHSIAVHDVANGRLRHRCNLHGRRSFGLFGRLLRASSLKTE